MRIKYIYQISTPELKRRELRLLVKRALRPFSQNNELSLILCDESEIAKLNYDYRGKEGATDVLSFPDNDLGYSGDVFVNYPLCLKRAVKHGTQIKHEILFLLIHGLLHCLGYDHYDKNTKDQMGEQENILLREVGLSSLLLSDRYEELEVG